MFIFTDCNSTDCNSIVVITIFCGNVVGCRYSGGLQAMPYAGVFGAHGLLLYRTTTNVNADLLGPSAGLFNEHLLAFHLHAGPWPHGPWPTLENWKKPETLGSIDKLQQRDRKKQEIVNAQNQKTNAQKPLT